MAVMHGTRAERFRQERERAEAGLSPAQRWAIARAQAGRRLATKFDPDEPRDESGKWTDGGGGDGGDGGASSGGGGGGHPGFSPGVKGHGGGADKYKLDWRADSPFKGAKLDEALAAAPAAQAELVSAGEAIAHEMGVKFVNPGVKVDRARMEEKLAQRDNDASAITDLARAGFVVDKPEQAAQVADQLGKHFGVGVEDWRVMPTNFGNKTLNVYFKNGTIGEVQISDKTMYDAKFKHGGDEMYRAQRSLDPKSARYQELQAQMAALYGKALDNYSPDWKAAFGIGGKSGQR